MIDFFGGGPGTYLDIGANIGLTTIPLARLPQVNCLAFEPEPQNFEYLKTNVSRNAPRGLVEVHQVALFHTHAVMSLALSETNLGDHRLANGSFSSRKTIDVQAVPLDDFLGRIKGRLAVKIDTQGAEPFVIAGGQKVLAKAEILSIEFCPYLMRQLGGDPNIAIDLIVDFDRVAIMPVGTVQTPHFISPAAAKIILQQKLVTAEASSGDYFDILAVRDV